VRIFLLIVRAVAAIYGDMSLSRRGRIVLLLCAIAGAAVGVYGYTSSHAVVSSVFLGIAAFTLVAVVGFLLSAAAALADEHEIVENVQVSGRRKKELEREKATLLKALKELEFDHEMGKVSDADFREIGSQYRTRAMRVLRQLDEQGADYKALVEKELKARLGVKKDSDDKSDEKSAGEKPTENQAEEQPPEEKKEHRKSDKKTALMRCQACGTTNDSDAVFCKKCGKKVAA
jgi:hypothetical protein